ncbi:MAG TPA: glycosyltransferase family 4 protein [Pyrinomonadaceae bacterium]|nr:glycosyltransferase family 4 protein [Pyrinomonadaceae bacterium]
MSRKLRIAFLTPEYVTEPYFDGGLGQYLHCTAAALAIMGHDVHVITLSQTEETSFVHDGVQVHRVRLKGGWQTLNQLTRYRLPTTTHWLNLSTQIYRRLRRLHADEAFDVVQSPNYSFCGLFSMLLLRVPQVLRISSVEPYFHDSLKEQTLDFKFLKALEWLQLRRSANIFSPSLVTQQILTKKYSGLTIDVIRKPIHVETSKNDYRIYDRFLRGRQYLLFFGRFTRRKGFEILVQSLAHVLDEQKDLSAVLVGRDVTTSATPSMAEYAHEVCGKFAERFIVLEQLPHQQLYPIITNAKLVVLPSIEDNLPNTCLEAMALARPVIGTYETSLSELITDEETGFLVAANDVEALTRKILYAWDHPRLQEIGVAAQTKVLKFSVEEATSKLLHYYQRVIELEARNPSQQPLSSLPAS